MRRPPKPVSASQISGEVGAARDGAHAAHDIGVARNAGIGQAEVGGRDAVAGHVERLKAHAVGDLGGDHVVDARRHDELRPSLIAPASAARFSLAFMVLTSV